MSKKRKRKQKPYKPVSKGSSVKQKAVEKEKKKEKAPKLKVKAAVKKEKKKTSPSKYFNEIKLELKKVSWPSRDEVIKSTIVVIIVVLILSIFTGILDFSFNNIIKVISKSFGSARFGG